MPEGSDRSQALIVEGRFCHHGLQEDEGTPIGIDAIDRIGVSRIAESLDISPQAIRKWRKKGKIPEDRWEDLRPLLRDYPNQVSAVAEVAEVSEIVDLVAPKPNRESGRGQNRTITNAAIRSSCS